VVLSLPDPDPDPDTPPDPNTRSDYPSPMLFTGYHASNKHDYIMQMTVWLKRREMVAKFEAQKTGGAWIGRKEGLREDDDRAAADNEANEAEVTGREEEKMAGTAVLIAKTPGYGYRSVNELIDPNTFGTIDFVCHLQDFLASYHLPLRPFKHL
jgi:SLT domain-containing protein